MDKKTYDKVVKLTDEMGELQVAIGLISAAADRKHKQMLKLIKNCDHKLPTGKSAVKKSKEKCPNCGVFHSFCAICDEQIDKPKSAALLLAFVKPNKAGVPIKAKSKIPIQMPPSRMGYN